MNDLYFILPFVFSYPFFNGLNRVGIFFNRVNEDISPGFLCSLINTVQKLASS